MGKAGPLSSASYASDMRTGSSAMGVLNNQRDEFFRESGSSHTSRGAMNLMSGLAFGSFAEASLKNSSTLDPIVPR